jgi:hypothetical protein
VSKAKVDPRQQQDCFSMRLSPLTEPLLSRRVRTLQVGVLMPISAFIALGLEHSVANMFIIPMGIALGAKVCAAASPPAHVEAYDASA